MSVTDRERRQGRVEGRRPGPTEVPAAWAVAALADRLGPQPAAVAAASEGAEAVPVSHAPEGSGCNDNASETSGVADSSPCLWISQVLDVAEYARGAHVSDAPADQARRTAQSPPGPSAAAPLAAGRG